MAPSFVFSLHLRKPIRFSKVIMKNYQSLDRHAALILVKEWCNKIAGNDEIDENDHRKPNARAS